MERRDEDLSLTPKLRLVAVVVSVLVCWSHFHLGDWSHEDEEYEDGKGGWTATDDIQECGDDELSSTKVELDVVNGLPWPRRPETTPMRRERRAAKVATLRPRPREDTDRQVLVNWPDGQVKESGTEDASGHRIGIWRRFHLNGRLHVERLYGEEGEVLSSSTHDEEGRLLYVYEVVALWPPMARHLRYRHDGRVCEEWFVDAAGPRSFHRMWNERGRLVSEVDHRRNGVSEAMSRGGGILWRGRFEDDRPVGLRTFADRSFERFEVTFD